MPEPLWIYLMALLYFTKLSTCSTMADAFDSASHDCLTRMLHGDWSGQTLFDLALRLLFVVAGGYLILDDTVVEKPAARLLGEAAWVWSNKQQKVVFGVSLVLLVWTDGEVRIPVGYRVWHKGGPSKVDLALALLSHARNRLKCKPQFVLFDSWYPAKRLLKRLKDYGWYFVCQLKKNRTLDGVALYAYHQHPYWHAVGVLSGGLKVLVVRHRRKYYVTNRLTLPAQGGAYPVPETPGGGGSDPGPQEPAEPGGLSSRLQAARHRPGPAAAAGPRASHCPLSGGLPDCGA